MCWGYWSRDATLLPDLRVYFSGFHTFPSVCRLSSSVCLSTIFLNLNFQAAVTIGKFSSPLFKAADVTNELINPFPRLRPRAGNAAPAHDRHFDGAPRLAFIRICCCRSFGSAAASPNQVCGSQVRALCANPPVMSQPTLRLSPAFSLDQSGCGKSKKIQT